MSAFLDAIRTRAATLGRRIVFPEAADPRTLDAVAEIVRAGLLRPVLLGSADLADDLRARGVEPGSVEIVDPVRDARRERLAALLLELRAPRGMTRVEAWERSAHPLFCGALLVRSGEADGCVAGAVQTTADVLRAAIWCVGAAPGIRTVSSSFYMVVPGFRGREREVLTFTDAGVVPEPTAAQLVDIACAAAEARRRIVGDEPRVAFLSYSTLGSADGASVARVREAVAEFRGRMPDVEAEGELQADAALIPAVAVRKAPGSRVAGGANVLVFPSLDAGNIAYKLVQRLAGAEAIGPILQGLARPCNDLSRGAEPADIVNAACITALQA